MPGAGFYAIGASHIRFGRDGHWYADGERITNRRIALLFARHLRRRADGTWGVEMGDERAPVDLEDTPWVVTQVEGDPTHGFTVTLNDQTQESLDPATLAVGADQSFSCAVKAGVVRARFLRRAHYALARWAEPGDAPGSFVLTVDGRRHLLGAEPPRH
jgi:hypothetical protein